jgi:transcription initiation factor TFIIIB Brf1 subunit/transcription initiation factor TFIIB
MSEAMLNYLTEQLIAYRKENGVSAARIVAAALELGYRHGQTEAAEKAAE